MRLTLFASEQGVAAHQAVTREMAGLFHLMTTEALGNEADEWASVPMRYVKEAIRLLAHPLVVAAARTEGRG